MTEEQLKEFKYYPNQPQEELYLDEIDKFMKDQRLKELTQCSVSCNNFKQPKYTYMKCSRCGKEHMELLDPFGKFSDGRCGECRIWAMSTGEIGTLQSSMSKL